MLFSKTDFGNDKNTIISKSSNCKAYKHNKIPNTVVQNRITVHQYDMYIDINSGFHSLSMEAYLSKFKRADFQMAVFWSLAKSIICEALAFTNHVDRFSAFFALLFICLFGNF